MLLITSCKFCHQHFNGSNLLFDIFIRRSCYIHNRCILEVNAHFCFISTYLKSEGIKCTCTHLCTRVSKDYLLM